MTGWYVLGWAFLAQVALIVIGSLVLDRVGK